MILSNCEQIQNEADRIMMKYGFEEELYESIELLLDACLRYKLEVSEKL